MPKNYSNLSDPRPRFAERELSIITLIAYLGVEYLLLSSYIAIALSIHTVTWSHS